MTRLQTAAMAAQQSKDVVRRCLRHDRQRYALVSIKPQGQKLAYRHTSFLLALRLHCIFAAVRAGCVRAAVLCSSIQFAVGLTGANASRLHL